jgi:hypothetical protein
MDETDLATWAAELAADLGVGQALDVDAVLKLAADAAHGVMRPAAPVTTFLVGLAIGRAGEGPARVADVQEKVAAALARWDGRA